MLLLCPQPEEDIVLHVVNRPLESCQVAKAQLVEASQGDLSTEVPFRASKARPCGSGLRDHVLAVRADEDLPQNSGSQGKDSAICACFSLPVSPVCNEPSSLTGPGGAAESALESLPLSFHPGLLSECLCGTEFATLSPALLLQGHFQARGPRGPREVPTSTPAREAGL